MRHPIVLSLLVIFIAASAAQSEDSPALREALRRGRLPGEPQAHFANRMKMLKAVDELNELGAEATTTSVRFGPKYRGGSSGLSLLNNFLELRIVEFVRPQGQLSTVDLSPLANIRTVRGLRIEGVRLGVNSLSHISQWRELNELALVDTGVSDGGIRVIDSFTKLNAVRLSEKNITGDALNYLRRSGGELKTLNLDKSGVTDEALVKLKPLTKLAELSVAETKVHDDALIELWKSHPDLAIVSAAGGKPAHRGEPLGQPLDSSSPDKPIGALRP